MEKTLFIIRGLPGSGKTKLARSISQFEFSADDYFMDSDGYYRFDASKLKAAHGWCQAELEKCMKYHTKSDYQNNVYGESRLAVANTSTRESEIQPYLDLAKQYGYTVHSIVLENRHGSKSIHDVSEKTVSWMRSLFEVKLD